MQRPESPRKMGWEKRGGRENTVVCSLVCTVHLIRVMVVISLDCRTSKCWFIHIKLREFGSLTGLKSVHVCAQISASGVSTSRNALLPLHLSQKLCMVVSATVFVGIPLKAMEIRDVRPLQPL